jgi:hypothetical protein
MSTEVCQDWCGWTTAEMEDSRRWRDNRPPDSVHWIGVRGYCSKGCFGIRAIADAIYRVDAPRYGNDIKPYDELGYHEKFKFETMARIAVMKWQSLTVDIPA